MKNGEIFYHFKKRKEKKTLNNVFGVGIRHFVSFLFHSFKEKNEGKSTHLNFRSEHATVINAIKTSFFTLDEIYKNDLRHEYLLL